TASPCAALPGAPRSGRQPSQQLSDRAAPVADRVLGGVGELRHRAGVEAVFGYERRVVAEPARPARIGREAPTALAEARPLDTAHRIDVRERAHVPAPVAGQTLPQQLTE